MIFSQKDGDPLRKSLVFILLVLLLSAVCAWAAADTVFALEPCSGTISISESNYIVLTAGNLDDHPELIASMGTTKEELLADWKERGVQLQAWNEKMDVCLEVTVVQDEDSQQYYDLEQQSKSVRTAFLKHLKSSGHYAAMGYTMLKPGRVITEPAWKKHTNGGNFIMFEYKRTVGDKTWRGVVRHAIRNGYTILLDYQVFNRLPLKRDDDNLRKIANTVTFAKVDPVTSGETLQPSSSPDGENAGTDDSQPASNLPETNGLLTVSVQPPAETADGIFTVEGTTTPGGHVIGVAMHWSNTNEDPIRFETTASERTGSFKLKFTLPQEGVWQTTLNLDVNGQIASVAVLKGTVYSKSTIPIALDAPVPAELHADELVISGKTEGAVQIQCIVSHDGKDTVMKDVRTNRTGKFTYKIPTVTEGTYEIVLSMQKKGFSNRRETYSTNRVITSEDTQNRTANKAIHPAYAALAKNPDKYIGSTIYYDVHILAVDQVEDEWIITGALKKNKDEYSNYVYYVAKSDPLLDVGNKVKLYGTLIGTHSVETEEGNAAYPELDYLFHE